MKPLPETITVGNVCVRLCPMKGSHSHGMSEEALFDNPWEEAIFRRLEAARHELPEKLRDFELVFPDLRHLAHNPNGGDKIFARTLIWSRGDQDWIKSRVWEWDDVLVGGGLAIRFEHLNVTLGDNVFRLSRVPMRHTDWQRVRGADQPTDAVETASFELLKAAQSQLPEDLRHCWLIENVVRRFPSEWGTTVLRSRCLKWDQDDVWMETFLDSPDLTTTTPPSGKLAVQMK